MWIKKDNYYLQDGDYTIAKTGIGEATRYTLYHKNERIEIFKTVEEAKAKHKGLTK